MENSRKQSTSSEKEDMSVNSLSLNSLDHSGDFKLHPLSEKSAGYSPSRSSISSGHSSPVHTMGQLTPTPPASEPVANRYVVEEAKPVKKKVDAGGQTGTVQEGGGTGRRFRPPVTSSWRGKREGLVKKTALGFRVFGFVFSLVSLSVMASDKNKGWALDSFDRYKEFRYCFSVNIIAFVYSAAQLLNLSIQLATGRSNPLSQYGYFLDFALDQMIAYLLISSSSSAATRVEDWEMNWGKDKFPQIATTAVATSFLAFAALAANSLISGYELLTPWMVATLVDFYINVTALAVWVAYKESSWICAVLWIILLICFGSITTCVYIVCQLLQISIQDHAYLVLVPHGDRAENKYKGLSGEAT